MSDEIPIGPGNPTGGYGLDDLRSLPSSTGSAIDELHAAAVGYAAALAALPKDSSFFIFSAACDRLEIAAEKYSAGWEAKRLSDYVRMYFEANPPMPDAIAVAWRDYLEERKQRNDKSSATAKP